MSSSPVPNGLDVVSESTGPERTWVFCAGGEVIVRFQTIVWAQGMLAAAVEMYFFLTYREEVILETTQNGSMV